MLESERQDKEAAKMVVMDTRLAEKNERIEQNKVREVVQTVAGARLSGKVLKFVFFKFSAKEVVLFLYSCDSIIVRLKF